MPKTLSTETISFGPFILSPAERLLTRDGARVDLSGRAYDILLMLVDRPNELVSKGDLLAGVWPGISVEEGSLRFHIANLRRTLGDGKDGARYIATSSGRGYTFVAHVRRSDSGNIPGVVTTAARQDLGAAKFQHANLPARFVMIDREEEIERLPARLLARRFVTVVGAGGTGKTTLAIAVGHKLADKFDGAVLFVDLSMVSDPSLVGIIVASLLGLSVQSDDATPSISAYLKDKQVLLILDTCEHLITAVAAFASAIFAAAKNVHILATSRESLQTEGETVFRLDPLGFPSEGVELTAEIARTFPAVQLFVERAQASGAALSFSDEEALAVVGMCRKLDGLALAIELAARRVKSYGVHQTAALLDERLTRLWIGPRDAPARQKTLHATIDWSYGLLSEIEKIVLRCMAVFVGEFVLAGVMAVSDNRLDEAAILDAVDSLVAKSMVVTRQAGTVMVYRLLDSTRAYARDIWIDASEAAELSLRHAVHCRDMLQSTGREWSVSTGGSGSALRLSDMNNVRVALEWCFGAGGDRGVGIHLAAAATQVFLTMSLLPECYRWSQQAILALDETLRGSVHEMHLQAGLGLASSQMHGEGEAARDALSRSLLIAEAKGDAAHQAGLLNMQHMFHGRAGNFRISLEYAQRCRAIAEKSDDPAIRSVAHAALGRALQFVGDLRGSRAELEALMEIMSEANQGSVFLGYDPHYRSGIALARTLWLQGFPDRAIERTREAVRASEASGHSAALALVLAGAGSIFLWAGELESAQECIDRSYELAEANGMGPLISVGLCRKAELMIHRGDLEAGVDAMRAALRPIHAARHELLTTEFNIELALALAELGQAEEGLELIDETVKRVEVSGELFQLPELLRSRARLLCALSRPQVNEAEQCLREALDLARAQEALAWELRAAVDLSELVPDHARDTMAVLQSVLDRYTEGFDTADLRTAKRLLLQ